MAFLRKSPFSACAIVMSRSMSTSHWAGVPMGPPDPILGLNEAFAKDTDKRKVNLGVGAYRDNNGQPLVLSSVRQAEEAVVAAKMNKEYAGIAGVAGFVNHSMKFAYGDSPQLKDGLVVGMQALSGTGSCRMALDFFARFKGKDAVVWVPDPTWPNHNNMIKDAGMQVKTYRYYDPATRGLAFGPFMDDLKAMPDGQIILFHSCAHNPTGVDPSPKQWSEIADLCAKKNHHAFMDTAYQGFASGNADIDGFSVREMLKKGVSTSCAQSFAKNFGLYGERVGAFSIVCANKDEKDRVESQLKILIRPMYSNPPIHGARIVEKILGTPELYSLWKGECKGMADRIIEMRKLLRKTVEANHKSKWTHITDQIGMFAYTGLTAPQCESMIKDHHIYMTKNGRVSMAGVFPGNVEYIGKAIAAVSQ